MKDQDPGIKLHPHPTFENKKAKLGHLPDLNLRWGFIGQSGSGKGVAMLDLLLRHYRGVFDRIYLYSKSSTIDKNWDPLKKYVEQELGVDQREEQTFFDEFDAQALQQQMDLQMKVAEEAKKIADEGDTASALDHRRPCRRPSRSSQQLELDRDAGHSKPPFRWQPLGKHPEIQIAGDHHQDQPDCVVHLARVVKQTGTKGDHRGDRGPLFRKTSGRAFVARFETTPWVSLRKPQSKRSERDVSRQSRAKAPHNK